MGVGVVGMWVLTVQIRVQKYSSYPQGVRTCTTYRQANKDKINFIFVVPILIASQILYSPNMK